MSAAEPPIAFSAPLIGEEEIAEVVEALRSGWITTGPRTARFESDFAAFVGAPAALAVNSCTAALHLGLLASGVGPGDAVITTDMTFCSTVHTIEHVGATPVLCDVEPDTLNISAEAVCDAVSRSRSLGLRPRVMVPVHFAGHPCDLPALFEVARQEGLAVIEDAAHALPARVDQHLVGAIEPDLRHAVAFSFYATKNLTTGEGGMLTTSEAWADEARVWSLHGMSRDSWKRYGASGTWHYEVTRAGFKYNMTDIAAALGIHQLAKLPQFDRTRQELAARYLAGLAEIDAVELPVTRPGVHHAWHLMVIRLRSEVLSIDRSAFIEELRARGVATSVHFIPIHRHEHYAGRYGFAAREFPVATDAFERAVSLPLHLRMSLDDVDRVVAVVAEVAASHRR